MKRNLAVLLSLFVILVLSTTSAFGAEAAKAAAEPGKEKSGKDDANYADAPDVLLSQADNDHRIRINVLTEIVQIANQDKSLMGIVLGAEAMYAFAESMGMGLSVRQAMAGTSSIFFSFDVRFTYALTGTLPIRDKNLYLGETPVYQREGLSSGGFRMQLLATQFLFSNASISLPFFGFGFSLGYEFSSSTKTNYKTGIRIDKISNGATDLMPMQGFFAVCFTL